MPIADNMVATVGNTPLIRLNHVTAGLDAEICVKAEFFNPLFSVKDRIGKSMIEAAEKDGTLKPGGLIIEPTSGNTGIALAFVARAKGYRCILTMPESMSIERRVLLRLLGAEIVLTPRARGMGGAIAMAKKLLEQTPGAFGPGQFDNPANPQVHRETTAEEIWAATEGNIDVFVAGVGTGGTITGVGRRLKEHDPSIRVECVVPDAFPGVEGLKPLKDEGDIVPEILDESVIDEMWDLDVDRAWEMNQALAKRGIFGGQSTGAYFAGVRSVAESTGGKGVIVTMINDIGERY
ncbi:MAG: cysteine synthase family protein, partial [Verrucomicrobiae bacterium]|nr:cysteine synthase family protein [Verrucomicrobiae bacterium]